MKLSLFASAACLVAAGTASADRFDRKLAGLSTQSQISKAVEVPAEFETEAEFEASRDTLLDISKDLCRRNHASSAIRSVLTRACVADTFKSAVDQLPDTPSRLALLAYWSDEMAPERGG